MTVRFLVIPGYVKSKNDGDKHWISVPQLVKLYGLRPGEWTDRPDLYRDRLLYQLHPRHDGDYGHPDD